MIITLKGANFSVNNIGNTDGIYYIYPELDLSNYSNVVTSSTNYFGVECPKNISCIALDIKMLQASTVTVYKCDITDFENTLTSITSATLEAGDSQRITFNEPIEIGGNIQLVLKGTGYSYCGTLAATGLTRAFYQSPNGKTLTIQNTDGKRNQIAVTYVYKK